MHSRLKLLLRYYRSEGHQIFGVKRYDKHFTYKSYTFTYSEKDNYIEVHYIRNQVNLKFGFLWVSLEDSIIKLEHFQTFIINYQYNVSIY